MKRRFLQPVSGSLLLGLRAPLRSRFVQALFVLLCATVLLLPAQLHSDGTEAGLLRMLLTWTLGAAFTLLSISALWSGCASVACDIEARRFPGTALSPAWRLQILAGRWLGILLFHAALLALVLIGLFAQASRRGLADVQETRIQRVLPHVEPEAEAERIIGELFPKGDVPLEKRDLLLRAILRDLTDQVYLAVEPGHSRRWRFPLGMREKQVREEGLRLRFSFVSSYGAAQEVKGELEVQNAAGERIFLQQTTAEDNGMLQCTLSPEVLKDAGGELWVWFRNLEPPQTGGSVLLRYTHALMLSTSGGGLAGNLARAGLALLAQLALLSALGVAMGSILSFPVAAFTASALCMSVLVSGSDYYQSADAGKPREVQESAHTHGGGDTSEAFTDRMGEFSLPVSRAFNQLLAPVREVQTLDRLGDCIYLELRPVCKALLTDGMLLSLLLLGCASVVLSRREYP